MIHKTDRAISLGLFKLCTSHIENCLNFINPNFQLPKRAKICYALAPWLCPKANWRATLQRRKKRQRKKPIRVCYLAVRVTILQSTVVHSSHAPLQSQTLMQIYLFRHFWYHDHLHATIWHLTKWHKYFSLCINFLLEFSIFVIPHARLLAHLAIFVTFNFQFNKCLWFFTSCAVIGASKDRILSA